MATLQVYFVSSLQDINPESLTPGKLFILPSGELYEYVLNGGEMGGFFGSIGGFFKKAGKVALSVAPVAVNAFPGIGQIASVAIQASAGLASQALANAGSGGVAKGLDGITRFGNEVIRSLDTLIQNAAGYEKKDVYTEADRLVNLLSDPNAVYQAKKGKDADALRRFKETASQKAIQAKAAADAADTLKQQQQQQQQQNQQQQLQAQIQQTLAINGIQTGNGGGSGTVAGTMGGGSTDFDYGKIALVGIGVLGLILILK
jgi:hypothetical protein